MKLKYYLNKNICMLVILSFIISAAIIQNAEAYTLDSSGVTRDKMFKCQKSTITANFTGTITSVDVMINNTFKVMLAGVLTDSQEKYTMSDLGGGQWSYDYGNNAGLTWGVKSIAFDVLSDGVHYTNTSSAQILVYSDTCMGVNIQGRQNISTGQGNYTKRLWTGEVDILSFALTPWLEYWGYVFYIIAIFWVALIIYMKNQNITQPLIILFLALGTLVTTTWLPPEYKQYVVMLLGLGLGGLLYRIFKQ